MAEKKYYPAIDVLKFIAVITIVLFHFADHGVVNLVTSDISVNWGVG